MVAGDARIRSKGFKILGVPSIYLFPHQTIKFLGKIFP